MEKAYRHGDLALRLVDKLPGDAKKSRSKTLMQGSNNNSHTIDNGTLYLKNDGAFVFGFLEAKNTMLYHIDHGKRIAGKKLREAKIPDGIYELRRQCEDTNEGMKPVLD